MEVDAAQPRPRTSHVRLALWVGFVGLIALVNYAARFTGGSGGSKGVSQQEVYSYSTFAGGTIIYAIWLGIVLLICIDRFDLLALRWPRSWGRALGLGASVVGATLVWEAAISYLPLPESPGQEQGITNVPWEPAHAGAFAANFVLFVAIAPWTARATLLAARATLLAPAALLARFACELRARLRGLARAIL